MLAVAPSAAQADILGGMVRGITAAPLAVMGGLFGESEEMSHRMRASENILGKPAQQVFAAHAHVDVSDDLPKNADELEKAAALYAAMIGAGDDAAGFFNRRRR